MSTVWITFEAGEDPKWMTLRFPPESVAEACQQMVQELRKLDVKASIAPDVASVAPLVLRVRTIDDGPYHFRYLEHFDDRLKVTGQLDTMYHDKITAALTSSAR